MRKSKVKDQEEFSIRTKDGKNLQIKVKILKSDKGPYVANFSHELKKVPANFELPCCTVLKELESRIENYIAMFKDSHSSNIILNENF